MTSPSNRRGRIIRIIITLVVVAMLIAFARTVDWHQAWRAVRTAALPLVILALVANLSTIFCRAARWWLLLRKSGAPSFWLAVRASFAGAGLNNILIANGGEAVRLMFISRATGVPTSRVLATVALDRLFDPLGFVMLLVAGTFAFPFPPEIERFRWPAAVLLVLMVGALIWMVSAKPAVQRAVVTLEQLPEDQVAEPVPPVSAVSGIRRWRHKAGRWVTEFGQSLRELAHGPDVVWMVILTVLAWLTQLATFAYAASATHAKMSIAASLAALLAVNLSLVVRATPGNVGFFQFAYVLATAPFGLATADAVAVSILIQVLQVVPVTIAGVACAPEALVRRRTPMASI